MTKEGGDSPCARLAQLCSSTKGERGSVEEEEGEEWKEREGVDPLSLPFPCLKRGGGGGDEWWGVKEGRWVVSPSHAPP